MKRCPECGRNYNDDSMSFCLDDGAELLFGPASMDEPATAILSEPPALVGGQFDSEAPTLAQTHTTGQTAILRTGAEAKPQESLGDLSKKQSFSANRAAKPLAVVVVAVLILAGGFFAYRYFAPTKQIESIAVMPFVNESGNADVEYLSDGMTETLISSLTQLPNLNVKARSSVFRYKGKETDAKTLGKELNVQAILNGRVIQRGDQLTLSLELVDVATENAIWSQQYSRKQTDLVSLQSEIARDVSAKLKSKFSRAEEDKVTKSYTTNPKALELYLKGRYFSRQFTLDGFNKGIDAFDQAIAIDPNYALAYAGLSDAYFYASTIRLPPAEAMPKVGEYARKALEIDSSLAAAHHSIANYKANYERDNLGAIREFEIALQLDPNDSSIFSDYSQLQSNVGDSIQGIALARRGKSVDPQDAGISGTLAQALVLSRRYDEGIEETRTTLLLDDKNWWAHYWRGVAYSEKGMDAEAIADLQIAANLDDSPLIRGVLASSLARAGRRAEAQRVIDELIRASKGKFVSQSSIAMGYAGLRDANSAFEWLDRSLESHDEAIVWIYRHPMFSQLRNDPRYRELLKKLNLG